MNGDAAVQGVIFVQQLSVCFDALFVVMNDEQFGIVIVVISW